MKTPTAPIAGGQVAAAAWSKTEKWLAWSLIDAQHNGISAPELHRQCSRELGLEAPSRRDVDRILRRLREHGLARTTGWAKAARWFGNLKEIREATL
jgi:hypothetical protein